jgi:FkbM family methyltransferase
MHPIVWRMKAVAEKIPGAFRVYKFVTSRAGEGQVYQITEGPLAGARWKRYNSLPYWYHRGLYEPGISGYILQHLGEGEVFWDVGAHAGYHALVAARTAGPHGQVVAIEPDPAICAIFREQLALNGITHCTVVQGAVSDNEGTVTLRRNALDSRTSALQSVGGRTGEAILVPSMTLDGMLARYPRPQMIKMDIEGAEVLALPAGQALFSGAGRPRHVLIGVHGAEAKELTETFLIEHGYRVVTPPTSDVVTTLIAVAR